MKVLLIIDSLGSGGAQRQLCLLACALKQRGWFVEFLIYHSDYDYFGPMLAAAEIPVIRLRKVARLSLRIPLEVAWYAQTGGYDVILAFLPTPTVYAALARAAGGPPLIVSERIDFISGQPSFVERWVAQAQRLAAVVVCNSRSHAVEFAAAFSWLRRRTLTIYNGAQIAPASPAPAPHEGLRLLAIGTITPRKNFLTVVEALGLLQTQSDPIPFVRWAGKLGHTSEDEAARDHADRRLATLGLTAHWEWLGERSDVPQLLAECDALIHASVREGFPNAVAEALAAGRPVLAGHVGDQARLIREGENGFLFDPADVASVAQAMRRALHASEAVRAAMGARARATAEAHFSVERMTDAYVGLFRGAIQAGTGVVI